MAGKADVVIVSVDKNPSVFVPERKVMEEMRNISVIYNKLVNVIVAIFFIVQLFSVLA